MTKIPHSTSLPIDEVLGDIAGHLDNHTRLVLAAPPGAGKTTRVPLDLLAAEWLGDRKILLLEPRRIAARMAARRMASTLGEKLGESVGLTTRVDRQTSARTEIEVITDGLFTRRILADPELKGVGLVIFDEFHERSLNVDLGLALALDAQEGLRPDLRLMVMSATLDTDKIAQCIDAKVIESAGRAFPVETIYLGRTQERVEDQAARAVMRALREAQGSVLVFLPGRGEIARTAERLGDVVDQSTLICPLYGGLSPAEQDSAVSPAPAGQRKIVLATDIAESALTIEGVHVVVDAGLARVAVHDQGIGVRLETRRASRANVDQRRGRAGRLGPGICYRLWDEAATRGLVADPVPEIQLADLSSLVLNLIEWGEKSPERLIWIDPPSAGRLDQARATLASLGAIDAALDLTEVGRDMARLPLAPPLAAFIARAKGAGNRRDAAAMAALLSEPGLGGQGTDIAARLERFRRDGSQRAKVLADQAKRWAEMGGVAAGSNEPPSSPGQLIANALPDNIARARDNDRHLFLSRGGRAFRLDERDSLAGATWLAIADASGQASGARILAAARLTEAEALAAGHPQTIDKAEFDLETKTLRTKRVTCLGAIVLSEVPLEKPSGAAARQALLQAVRTHGLELLAHAAALREFQRRVALARAHGLVPPDTEYDVSDEALIAALGEWLAPLLESAGPRLDAISAGNLTRAMTERLGWETARKLDVSFPLTQKIPSGQMVDIDYMNEGGPTIAARAQAFFGSTSHPTIGNGRIPLTVSLLSPAHRQIALTRDLPAFWKGGYRDMAKDMRGRYPKHDWPDDPSTAKPHEGKTKARL